MPYCWWKKSCTTWDVQNPVNDGMFTISTGAGFQPSTVGPRANTYCMLDCNMDWVSTHRRNSGTKIRCCFGCEFLFAQTAFSDFWELTLAVVGGIFMLRFPFKNCTTMQKKPLVTCQSQTLTSTSTSKQTNMYQIHFLWENSINRTNHESFEFLPLWSCSKSRGPQSGNHGLRSGQMCKIVFFFAVGG